MNRPRGRHGSFAIGIGVIVALTLVTLLTFGGAAPFGSPFRLDAIVRSANQVREGAPVRLGGVEIGRVASVAPGPGHTSRLVLSISEESGRIRSDATLAVMPRLLLEGNAYIHLSLGTPAAPRMRSGATIPLERTHVAVQLDQVVGVFDRPLRRSFKRTVAELSRALGTGGGRGPSGADGLRRAARELDAALGSVQRVAGALQGQAPNDLSRAIGSTGAMTEQLALSPASLANVVRNYNRVLGALSDNAGDLAHSIRRLDALLRAAPEHLVTIDRALPPVRRFAAALDPSLARAPRALGSGRAALAELSGLVSERELGGLLADLRPSVDVLPSLSGRLRTLFSRLDPIGRCLTRNVIPVLNMEVPDGQHSTGRPVWQDALHFGAALTSFASTFDGNGTAFRLGTQLSESGLTAQMPDGRRLYGAGDIVGRSPVTLRSPEELQYRPDQPCAQQALPDLTARRDIGLPEGLQRTRRPGVTAAERALRTALLSRDKRSVLDALLDLIPGARHPERAHGRKRPAGRMRPPVKSKPEKATERPKDKPRLPNVGLLPEVEKTVEDLLDALPITPDGIDLQKLAPLLRGARP